MKQVTVSVRSRLRSQPRGYAKTTNRIDSFELKENALGSCGSKTLSFIKGKGGINIDETNNILYRAACAWLKLTEYQYVFTYGYKKQLYKINLTFSLEEFPHLAGFQYLKDLTLPKYTPQKIVKQIINEKIRYEQIRKGFQFEQMVKPRLESMVHIGEILDNDFYLFTYMPQKYPFVTTIKADYLISSHRESINYVFIIKDGSKGKARCDFLCCSTFTKDERDYEANQRPCTLLLKERIHIPTNTSTILMDRLRLQNQ